MKKLTLYRLHVFVLLFHKLIVIELPSSSGEENTFLLCTLSKFIGFSTVVYEIIEILYGSSHHYYVSFHQAAMRHIVWQWPNGGNCFLQVSTGLVGFEYDLGISGPLFVKGTWYSFFIFFHYCDDVIVWMFNELKGLSDRQIFPRALVISPW